MTKKGVGTKRADSAGSFSNQGGRVIANPHVFVSFWGRNWNVATSADAPEAARLIQFTKDLLSSSIMELLSQYGVGGGTFVGSYLAPVSGNVTDAEIQQRLQSQIDAGQLPEPSLNQVVIIFFDETVAVNDPSQGLVLCEPRGDTAFGYHNFFTTVKGNSCVYAIIPALTNACVIASCGAGPGCTLVLSDTQEQRVTEVATHEFGEMVTDPELNAWIDASGNEIGDVCAGVTGTITVGSNMWKVQKLWDNNAGTCSLGTSLPPDHSPHKRHRKHRRVHKGVVK